MNKITDYQRIEKAIVFLQNHHKDQPGLEDLAEHLKLSPGHLQKLFTRWAGISPQRFLHYLNVSYAREQMAHTRNLFDLTLDTGLSSAGRLHDQFVTLVAMSPGEYQEGGKGLRIAYAEVETSFGTVFLATTPRGICACSFLDPQATPGSALQALKKQWPQANFYQDPESQQRLTTLAATLFEPLSRTAKAAVTTTKAHPTPALTAHVQGSNFQIQVWQALLRIPIGGLQSYGDIAQHIGQPNAARAVGTAIGQNPVAVLIPCHRVLRSSGALGGYRWGTARKQSLMAWEASQREQTLSKPNSLSCIECKKIYAKGTSAMAELCPACAHTLYGYPLRSRP
jgi:AraC family transcriptional regulator, regulatory protein of adaptative response / methylated-DNA-[protein]-cysteine methyltransferase